MTENFATSYLLSFTLGSLVSAHVTYHIFFISKSSRFCNFDIVNFHFVNLWRVLDYETLNVCLVCQDQWFSILCQEKFSLQNRPLWKKCF